MLKNQTRRPLSWGERGTTLRVVERKWQKTYFDGHDLLRIAQEDIFGDGLVFSADARGYAIGWNCSRWEP